MLQQQQQRTLDEDKENARGLQQQQQRTLDEDKENARGRPTELEQHSR